MRSQLRTRRGVAAFLTASAALALGVGATEAEVSSHDREARGTGSSSTAHYRGTFGGQSRVKLTIKQQHGIPKHGTFVQRDLKTDCEDSIRRALFVEPVVIRFISTHKFYGQRNFVTRRDPFSISL